jgi:hypothetical protein
LLAAFLCPNLCQIGYAFARDGLPLIRVYLLLIDSTQLAGAGKRRRFFKQIHGVRHLGASSVPESGPRWYDVRFTESPASFYRQVLDPKGARIQPETFNLTDLVTGFVDYGFVT